MCIRDSQGAALHAEDGVHVIPMNGVVNGRELHRAHEPVDAAVNPDDGTDDLQPQILRVDDRDESPQRDRQETEANVDALLAGLHVEPDLKDVVRQDDQRAGEKNNERPGPAHVRPVGDFTDGIGLKAGSPLHDEIPLLRGEFFDERNHAVEITDGLRHDEVLAVHHIRRDSLNLGDGVRHLPAVGERYDRGVFFGGFIVVCREAVCLLYTSDAADE